MTADMIVDFPQHHRKTHAAVHFSETSQLQVFERPEVARNELWYTKRDYARMRLAIRRDVLSVRTSGDAVVGDDTNNSIEAEESVCLMGIEHLLTPACMNEVRACRARCIQAVLIEQARQGDAGWDRIAFVSIAETRRAKMRARKLGQLHQESI